MSDQQPALLPQEGPDEPAVQHAHVLVENPADPEPVPTQAAAPSPPAPESAVPRRRRARNASKPEIPSAGLAKWKRRIRQMVVAEGGQAKFAKDRGLVPRTVGSWMDDKGGPPELQSMWMLDQTSTYSIAEQMQDLFELTEQDLDVTAPLWTPSFSHEHVLDRLRNLLDESNAQVPSTASMAAAVLQSCAASDDPGRWRVRLFDVVSGWDFPYVGHNVIEFNRWFGPYLGPLDDPEPERGKKFVEDAKRDHDRWQLGMHDAWRSERPAPAFLQLGLPAIPIRQEGDPPPKADAVQRLWNRMKTEREELSIRLGEALLAARGEWAGAWGLHHLPLLGATRRSRALNNAPRPRHLWVEPAPRQPLSGPVGVGDVANGRTTVLLLAPSGMAVHRIGDLVAEALGWTTVTHHDLVQRMRGHRVGLTRADAGGSSQLILRQLTKRPLEHTVVSVNMNYLFTGHDSPGGHQVLDQAMNLLTHPAVLPVLLRPHNSESLELWEQRVQESVPDADKVDRHQTARGNLETLALWDASVRDRIGGHWEAIVGPDFPWSGDAVMPDDAFAPAWYRHPLIGDIAVRVAFEVSVRMLTGNDVTRIRSGGRGGIQFARGSVLASYRDALLAATPIGAPVWSTARDAVRCDEKYRSHPKGRVPQGRAIASWSRTT